MGRGAHNQYPDVGDEIQLVIGRKEDVLTLAFYNVVEGEGTDRLVLQFVDVRVVKESDIPF